MSDSSQDEFSSASDVYLAGAESDKRSRTARAEETAAQIKAHLLHAQQVLDMIEAEQVADAAAGSPLRRLELSVVMPCLNEAETLKGCIEKAMQTMRENQIAGEVIVADNGSTDGSQEIAKSLGARVIPVEEQGYGSLLMGGLNAARGKYIITGEADGSYDFAEIPRFMKELKAGHDLVQGCRLSKGGGKILPGAMPVVDRWLGNPILSFLVRGMFGAPIHDVHCGMRGFKSDLFKQLNLRCTEVEIATEIVIKSALFKKDIAEVPVTLHPDKHKTQAPHARTFRDGWRTVWFFLMYSPRWLFLAPGLSLMFFGLLGYALAMPGFTVLGTALDAHTLLVSSLSILLGYQTLLFAIFTKTFAAAEGLMPEHPKLGSMTQSMNLERGLLAGSTGIIAGGIMLCFTVTGWWRVGFGTLDYSQTMRWVIPGVTLTALGFQTITASFFVNILKMARKKTPSAA